MKIRDGIKIYEVEGEALDNAWITRNREMLEGSVYNDMRSNGYVPVLDFDPEFSSEYLADTETFKFKISVQGYKMGDKAADYLGILLGDGIMISADARRVALCDGEGF